MANEDLVIWEPNEREQEWLDNHQEIRSYEVSIWTLQDDFITVLKYANVENKGQIQDGKAKFNVDGTQELTFTIPMYLYNYQTNILEENPIWYNTRNGNIAIDMRKIKLIFNKESADEKVYEFLITKINERHSNDQLFCDVSCEGLAFHELGKIGYKVSLTPDDFYNDDYDWFKEKQWTDSNGEIHTEQPIANLQYWLNKFLYTSYSSPNKWYYSIEMNYDAYVSIGGEGRKEYIVYEEPYASSWHADENGNITVTREEGVKEKERLGDLEESNIYNLTQNLAETFEVFCRYEYEHDENYHITGRKIIFYNNFIYENEKYGYIDFTYPYSTAEITREMDSTDLVTKMFVQAVEDETTASGLLTIINTEANKSGEDYLLNFDYLHDIKAISEEQYEEVERYEIKMKQLNQKIAPIESQIIALSAQLPSLEAKLKIASNAIQLDTERIGAASDLFNAITEGDGEIEITAMNPATAIMLQDQGDDINKSYYINLSKHGIDSTSIRIFRQFDVTKTVEYPEDDETGEGSRLFEELKTGRLEYDEFGDVIKVKNLYLKNTEDRKTVFLTYNYTPKLYYDRVVKTWKNRLEKDTQDRDKYTKQIADVKDNLQRAQDAYDNLIANKKTEIKKFEQLMGPALREGYWNPDDYKDCGDKYIDEITITEAVDSDTYDHRKSTRNAAGQKELLNYFIWDSELFNNEFDAVYEYNTEQYKKKYPCIDLSEMSRILTYGNPTAEEIKNRIENLSFFFCDYNGYDNGGSKNDPVGSHVKASAANMRAFAVGSQCQYGFIKKREGLDGHKIIPVLILNGMETIPEEVTIKKVGTEETEDGEIQQYDMTDHTITMESFIKGNKMAIGAVKLEKGTSELQFEDWSFIIDPDPEHPEAIDNYWITDYECTVYPRMAITSLAVKTSSDQLFVTYAEKEIKNVEDYYCLSKIPGLEENGNGQTSSIDLDKYKANYYITLKPETMFKLNGFSLSPDVDKNKFGIKYVISNADTSIYLDAKKILKENAYPKVSYTIKLSTLNRKFMRNAYDRLCYIAHINDAELKFQNTMGYISQVDLDLDKPWEDEVEVKNYKTKFEDLFSTILASTEEMKKTGYALRAAASAFDAWGSIKPWALEGTIYKVDLDYAFNQGTLTITEKDGIWGVSESGVVAIRGGGIFTSTEQDGNGNWKWNTGITPEGINATLITAGQLDTNRVMVYAGDKLRFQLNGEGLFAYKSFFEDLDTINDWVKHPENYTGTTHDVRMTEINKKLAEDENSDLDAAQFVKMDSNGLFLIAKQGALVLNSEKTDYIKIGERLFQWVAKDNENEVIKNYIPPDGIERVAITWDGFSLKNYYDQKVLYADADTGNLSVKGTIFASELNIGGEGEETTLSLNQYLDVPDKLIVEGLTSENIDKLENITTIFYVAENDLINYLHNESDENLNSESNNKKQGKNGDIWYDIRSPKKELTIFRIVSVPNPIPKKTETGDELDFTPYDYWKMQQLEDKTSDFKFAKALMGIYQSNVDGTKYNTIYKCDCEATSREVEVVIEPETFTISFLDKETGAEISDEDLISSTAKDIEATLHNKAAKIEKEFQDIPLEDQVPNLAAINVNSEDLKFGDIWINPNAKDDNNNSIIAIYRWDADYENEEELLTEEYESLIDKVEKDDVEAHTNNAAALVDDTPDSSNSSSSENLTSGKWVLLNNVSAIAMEDKVLYDLLKAEGKVGRIAHGEYGLIFTDSKRITDIQLNKKVGLQIKSRDGAYFRVNSSQFGFVSADGKTPYLYYEDGNLYIMGTIFARRFYVLESAASNAHKYTFDEYLGYHFENQAKISATLKEIFDAAGQILTKAQRSITDVNDLVNDGFSVLSDFKEDVVNNLTPIATTGTSHNALFKPGDVWNRTVNNDNTVTETYIAVSYWNKVYDSEADAAEHVSETKGWSKTHDYSLAAITGANFAIDSEAGTFDIWAQKSLTLKSAGTIYLGANQDVNIVGNENVNIGGTTINIASSDDTLNNLGGIHLTATKYDGSALTGYVGSSVVDINGEGIVMASKGGINIKSGAGITIKSSTNSNVSVIDIDNSKGIWLGSSQKINLFSGALTEPENTGLTSGAAVEIGPTRILMGVSNITNGETTAIDITESNIIIGAGIVKATMENDDDMLADITDDNSPYQQLKRNDNLSGVVISQNAIGMATGNNSERSLLLLESSRVRIGAADSETNGNYIEIDQNPENGITIAGQETKGSYSQIIIRPSTLVMTTAGKIQLIGNRGKIVFGDSEDAPKFRVDEDGNVYCNSITCVEGYNTGTIPQTQDTPLWTGTANCTLSGTNASNEPYFSSSEPLVLPDTAKYTVIVQFTATGSVYLKNAKVYLRTGSGASTLNDTDSSSACFPIKNETKTFVYELTGTKQVNRMSINVKIEEGSVNLSMTAKLYRNFKGSSTDTTVQGTQGEDGTSYTVKDTYSDRILLNFTHGWVMSAENISPGDTTYTNPTYLVYNTLKDMNGNVISKTKFFETGIKTEYDTDTKLLMIKATETKFKVDDNSKQTVVDNSEPISDVTLYTFKKADWTSSSAITVGTQEQKIQKQKYGSTTWEDTGIITSLVSSWDAANHKYKIIADGASTSLFETTLSGSWSDGTYKVYADTNTYTGISITPTLSLDSAVSASIASGNVLNSNGITATIGAPSYYPITIVEGNITKYIKINAAASTTSTLTITGHDSYTGGYYNISPTTTPQYITATMSGASSDSKTIRIYGYSVPAAPTFSACDGITSSTFYVNVNYNNDADYIYGQIQIKKSSTEGQVEVYFRGTKVGDFTPATS